MKSKISGNWDFIDSTQQLKAIEVSVTITGEEFSGNSIYLFLPKAESK
ncbi:hypothetical protein [Mycoplasma ovis]|nr:hypothetical protein [Mycoplasma ovis]